MSRSEFRRQAVDCFAFNSHVLQNCRLLHFIRAKSLLRLGGLFGLQAILMGVRNAQWGNVPLLRAEEYRPVKKAA